MYMSIIHVTIIKILLTYLLILTENACICHCEISLNIHHVKCVPFRTKNAWFCIFISLAGNGAVLKSFSQ